MLRHYFTDDILYGVVIVLSFAISFLMESPIMKIDSSLKKYSNAFIGFVFTFMVAGPQGILISLLFTVCYLGCLNLIPIRFYSSMCFLVVLFVPFLMRISYWIDSSGLCNALIMILSLRGYIYCMDVKNGYINHHKTIMNTSHSLYSSCNLDFTLYMFCYIGLFTGPLYTFKTYYDGIYSVDGTYNFKIKRDEKFCINSAKKLIFKCILFALIMTTLQKLSNIDYVLGKEDNWLHVEYGVPLFLSRLLLCMILMFTARSRFYCAWYASEATCVIAGFGIYPEVLNPRVLLGPTKMFTDIEQRNQLIDSNLSHITINNNDVLNIELSIEALAVVDKWNCTVRHILSHYIAESCPFPKYSALWHGTHSGYLISFLSYGALFTAEIEFKKLIQHKLKDPYYKKVILVDEVIDAFKNSSISKMIILIILFVKNWIIIDYMMIPFLVLSPLSSVIDGWRSFYFIGHFYIVGLFLISFLLHGKNKQYKNNKEKI